MQLMRLGLVGTSACLRQSLCAQNHRAIVTWAFACIDDIAAQLHGRVPGEERIERALSLCKAWARGEVKMPVAKRALLDVHAMAREVDSPCDIALLHAMARGVRRCTWKHTPSASPCMN